MIYKVFRIREWHSCQAAGVFDGSADDRRDGFIHFSFASQLDGTLARFFGDVDGVVLAEVQDATLPPGALRTENGFPHLYAPLDLSAVTRHWTLRRVGATFALPDLGNTHIIS